MTTRPDVPDLATSDPPAGRESSADRYVVLAAYLLAVAVALVFCFFGKALLPQQFFNDSDTFQRIMDSPSRLNAPNDNYAAIARVYAVLGLADARAVVGASSLLLFIMLQLRACPLSLLRGAPVLLLGTYLAAPLMVSVFLGGFSKDALAIIVVLGFTIPRGRPQRWLALVVLGSMFAISIRSYWFLILVLALLLRWLAQRGARVMIVGALATPLAAVLSINAVLGVPVTSFRDDTLADLAIRADSTIVALVPGDGLASQVANSYYFLLLLLLPLIAGLREVLQFAAGALLCLLWINGLRSLAFAACAPGRRLGGTEADALAVCLAGVLVFSLFEPDLGSYTRHLLPFMPLLLGLWARRRLA